MRVYIYQHRLQDAAEFYQSSNGCSEEEAAQFVQVYAADLRKTPGYTLKVFLFRILLVFGFAVPNGLICALAGIVWASALGKSLLQFGTWAFLVSGLLAGLLSSTLPRTWTAREGAFALGSLFWAFGGIAVVVGVIVGIVQRIFF